MQLNTQSHSAKVQTELMGAAASSHGFLSALGPRTKAASGGYAANDRCSGRQASLKSPAAAIRTPNHLHDPPPTSSVLRAKGGWDKN